MVWRVVAPCLDCGGDPSEVYDPHKFARIGLFDSEMFCDFCDADMPSTDPTYWGFPADLDWDKAMAEHSYEPLSSRPSEHEEWVCPKCYTLLRKQQFILKNASRNGIELSREYWKYLVPG